MSLNPNDYIGRRVVLVVDECWSAAVRAGNRGGWVAAGARGTIRKTDKVVHVEFDRMEPSPGFMFGLGETSMKMFVVTDKKEIR